jgi:MFS family permease
MGATDLSAVDIERGLRNVTWFSLMAHVMGTLVGGVFLIKIALIYDASLFVIGLLASLPSLANLAQIPATYLVERTRNRKRIAIVSYIGVRIAVLTFVVIPFVIPTSASAIALTVLLVAVFVRGLCDGAAGTAWNSWLRDLVPEDQMGSFFAGRMKQNQLVSMALSLGAALFISEWLKRNPANEIEGYGMLFFAGLVVGTAGLYFLIGTPEPKMPAVEMIPFRKLFFRPFQDRNFRHLMQFRGTWEFGVALAGPFFTVYLLQRLGYPMPIVIGLTVLSQLAHASFSEVWARIGDQFNNKAVLSVSVPIKLLAIGLWLFTALPDRHAFTLALLVIIHVLLGVANAGVGLATGNIGRRLAPRGTATPYLAAKNLVGAIAATLGPIAGGIIANTFAGQTLSITLNWTSPTGMFSIDTFYITGIDFAFIFAIVIGIYSLHRLSLVVEGDREDTRRSAVFSTLMAESRAPILSFTTIGGFGELYTLPFDVLRRRNGRKATAE